MPWEPEEVVDLYNQVVNILKEVNPDLTIVDSMHVPALTAAHNLRVKWMVLAPNTIKDFAVPYQPYGAALWKYPLIGSALPYPVPWSQMAANIGLTLILAMTMLTDTYMKTTTKLLQEQTKNDKLQIITLADLGVVYAPPPGVQIVVAFSEDLDYPISVIPPHISKSNCGCRLATDFDCHSLTHVTGPCGPVVRHAHKLAVADHELEKWLARGPTVYANLGSQFRVTAAEALEFALGLRDLLDAASSNLQILWKLKRATTGFSWDGEWGAVREAVLAEMEAGRVRIVGWVQADPCAVLQSGHIVCSVHHGGANSHHEALVAGLPQVMLPGWIDCYDYANRAELNGYGIRANKTAAPRWNRAEFGAALKEVIVGERAAMFAENAAKLAARHPAAAGRDKAAKAIMEILGSEG